MLLSFCYRPCRWWRCLWRSLRLCCPPACRCCDARVVVCAQPQPPRSAHLTAVVVMPVPVPRVSPASSHTPRLLSDPVPKKNHSFRRWGPARIRNVQCAGVTNAAAAAAAIPRRGTNSFALRSDSRFSALPRLLQRRFRPLCYLRLLLVVHHHLPLRRTQCCSLLPSTLERRLALSLTLSLCEPRSAHLPAVVVMPAWPFVPRLRLPDAAHLPAVVLLPALPLAHVRLHCLSQLHVGPLQHTTRDPDSHHNLLAPNVRVPVERGRENGGDSAEMVCIAASIRYSVVLLINGLSLNERVEFFHGLQDHALDELVYVTILPSTEAVNT